FTDLDRIADDNRRRRSRRHVLACHASSIATAEIRDLERRDPEHRVLTRNRRPWTDPYRSPRSRPLLATSVSDRGFPLDQDLRRRGRPSHKTTTSQRGALDPARQPPQSSSG